jgi:hypothetical protein
LGFNEPIGVFVAGLPQPQAFTLSLQFAGNVVALSMPTTVQAKVVLNQTAFVVLTNVDILNGGSAW